MAQNTSTAVMARRHEPGRYRLHRRAVPEAKRNLHGLRLQGPTSRLAEAEGGVMAQNTSTAVMARRHEPHTSLDDFPTPPWATRALCEWLQETSRWRSLHLSSVREPAANRGHMVAPLREYFASVEASDVHDYGAGFPVRDYLLGPAPPDVGWTITNPPFRLAAQFVRRALETSRVGVAIFVRTAFLEGINRCQTLFTPHPPAHVLQFSERVVLHRGRLAPEGSTATAYCWIVWRARPFSVSTTLHWLPPCRRQLERPGDYPPKADTKGA